MGFLRWEKKNSMLLVLLPVFENIKNIIFVFFENCSYSLNLGLVWFMILKLFLKTVSENTMFFLFSENCFCYLKFNVFCFFQKKKKKQGTKHLLPDFLVLFVF